MRPRIRVLCLPDLDKAIGGVKQLYRHVEHLVDLGWDALIVTEVEGFRPSWFASSAPTMSFASCCARNEFQRESTILLLPETYIGVDLRDFRGKDLSRFSRVVFNQNAYYSYGQGSAELAHQLRDFYDMPYVLQVLSISEDTHDFLSSNLGLSDSKLSRIINAIEPIFSPNKDPDNILHWMPRKNPADVQAVLMGIQRADIPHSVGWQGKALQGLSHDSVASRLNKARIFLSFGHPEGFGLPIAEAMASGCWVVGYSGGGGRELFRFGASEEIAFGDWTGFIKGFSRALFLFATQPRETALRLQRQSTAIRNLYSYDQERLSIYNAWDNIEKSFNSWRISS